MESRLRRLAESDDMDVQWLLARFIAANKAIIFFNAFREAGIVPLVDPGSPAALAVEVARRGQA